MPLVFPLFAFLFLTPQDRNRKALISRGSALFLQKPSSLQFREVFKHQ